MSEVQQEPRESEVAGVVEESGAAAALTVGQRLRAARTAAGLTTADVARSLKFSPRQVEQLEADDHAALPGNTIVRGFTRSYARLLGLDAEELLQQLGACAPNAPAEVRPPDNMGLASAPGVLRQLSLTAAAAIVITLAALLIVLWQFLGPGMSRTVSLLGKGTPAPVPVSAPAVDPVVPATAGLPGADRPDAAAPAVASAPPPPPSLPVAATQAEAAVLLFVFEGRSWLEVSDAAKQVLHSGENIAGSRLTLTGKPPFDIVVGNAGRVRLTYGEREIDLAPYTRAEVARLKLE